MSTQAKTIAIVEDDASVLKGIELLLHAYGFATEVYTSAEAFLDRADQSKATCAIVDIHLGGISGIELKRRLTACGSNLSVIFMTAADDAETQRQAMAAGCIAYLRKPFPANLLIDAITRSPA
jgi:FixJ family two-component response regulator